MTTDFFVLSSTTVPVGYSWDFGPPQLFANITQAPESTQTNLTGYAPIVDVIFANRSVPNLEYNEVELTWDFGDYYNNTTNVVSLPCYSVVRHRYIMPGTYTVTLKHSQTKKQENNQPVVQPIVPINPFSLCLGKYDTEWYWSRVGSVDPFTGGPNTFATTWNETGCELSGTSTPKTWANEYNALQKYCKIWTWEETQTEKRNPVKWTETETNRNFQKKWMSEINDTVCNIQDFDIDAPSNLNITGIQEQVTTKKAYITVLEIPPVASIFNVYNSTGTSPHTVRLSPRNCKPGSFPIDRIDWDFGDGSPIKTVSRYSLPTDPESVNTNYFISDDIDVRNIDVLHTYYRDKEAYPVFYPSLTCYSANTNTSDSCCITIGPISFTETNTDVKLLKSRNTNKGNLHIFSKDEKISFITTTSLITSFLPTQPTVPPLIIRDGANIPQPSFGHSNNNNVFPGIYIPSCIYDPSTLTTDYLIVENPTTYGALSTEEVPILTEVNFFIAP